MTKEEYDELQNRLSSKLKNHRSYCTNKEQAFNEGILAAKSIVSELYKRSNESEIRYLKQENKSLRQRIAELEEIPEFEGIKNAAHGT